MQYLIFLERSILIAVIENMAAILFFYGRNQGQHIEIKRVALLKLKVDHTISLVSGHRDLSTEFNAESPPTKSDTTTLYLL